ncbi:MAG: hypothetical protein RJA22_220 [Verrucomicrobiota bacterium]
MLLSLALLAGCRSLPPIPSPDHSGPGWTLREGQAVWRASARADGVAGDLLLATHPDGRCVVRFTKAGLPLLEAWRAPGGWRVGMPPAGRVRGGNGAPPSRVLWLQLPRAVEGGVVPAGWILSGRTEADARWVVSNPRTGEQLAGFLGAPVRRP